MADARAHGHEPAPGLVRARSAARRGGDDDAGPVPVARRRVVVYHAADCSLCARALEIVRQARAELAFGLELVDIAGSDELEARYRELIPVVKIDGEVAFTYFVDPKALLDRLRAVPPASPQDGQAES